MSVRDETLEKEALSGRLSELLAARGMSARGLSLGIGANVTYVSQLISGKGGMPSADKLRRIAEALGTTTDYLIGKVATPEQPASEVSFTELQLPFRPSGDGIPLLGTAYCDDLAVEDPSGGELQVERVQLETDHTVRLIERPPALWNARDAYAIYFHGSSMEPRFYQGEIGVVDPRRPPGPGDFVVVQLNDGEGDSVVTVLVKQLVRTAGGFVELRQFNPETTFRVPRGQVARLHRIYTPNELLGG